MEQEELEDPVELDGDPDLVIATRDFQRLADSRSKSGYVEGVEAGKDEGLQEGFSNGFVSGVRISSLWAVLRGTISAAKVHYGRLLNTMATRPHPIALLEELEKDVKSAEMKWRESVTSVEKDAYRQALEEDSMSQHHPDPSILEATTSGREEDSVAMDIEPVVKSSDVKYGEIIGSLDVPSVISNFRIRLQEIISKLYE